VEDSHRGGSEASFLLLHFLAQVINGAKKEEVENVHGVEKEVLFFWMSRLMEQI